MSKFFKIAFVVGCVFGILLLPVVIFANAQIAEQSDNVYDDPEDLYGKSGETLLVLGGGINSDATPRPLLEERLKAAAELYRGEKYDNIIVSGDNRFEGYDEPSVMKKYLVEEQGIDEAVIQEDFAGRSTYESCERAAKIFDIKEVVIISQRSHLPRAIFLCKQFGINATGYVANDVPGLAKSQQIREVAANVKAFINVYIVGEQTVLGEKIPL